MVEHCAVLISLEQYQASSSVGSLCGYADLINILLHNDLCGIHNSYGFTSNFLAAKLTEHGLQEELGLQMDTDTIFKDDFDDYDINAAHGLV